MDPVTATALKELVQYGVLGIVFVLTVAGSITGQVQWKASVERADHFQAETLKEVRAQLAEAMIGWKAQTDATNRMATAVEKMTAAIEERSKLEREYHDRDRRGRS